MVIVVRRLKIAQMRYMSVVKKKLKKLALVVFSHPQIFCNSMDRQITSVVRVTLRFVTLDCLNAASLSLLCKARSHCFLLGQLLEQVVQQGCHYGPAEQGCLHHRHAQHCWG